MFLVRIFEATIRNNAKAEKEQNLLSGWTLSGQAPRWTWSPWYLIPLPTYPSLSSGIFPVMATLSECVFSYLQTKIFNTSTSCYVPHPAWNWRLPEFDDCFKYFYWISGKICLHGPLIFYLRYSFYAATQATQRKTRTLRPWHLTFASFPTRFPLQNFLQVIRGNLEKKNNLAADY